MLLLHAYLPTTEYSFTAKRESKGFNRAKWPNGLKYYGSPNNKGKN